jgi:penicillin-binding protein 2
MVRARLKVLLIIFSIPPLAILLRLAWLQLVPSNHRELLRQSEHRRNIFSAPVRGRILSRDGSPLAANSPVYRLRFHYPSLNPRAELLLVIERELRKRGPFPDARAIEERLLEIANPRALASKDPSGPEWLPLIEKLDDDAADALRRSLRKHRAIFQVTPRPGSGRHDLLVEIRRATHMETALHRLARILAPARGTDPQLAYGSLRDQVDREMERMESLVEGDVVGETNEEYRLKKAQTSRRIHLENSWLLADDVPPAAVTEIEYYPDRYTGLQVEDGIRRSYPLREAAGTITGYLGHRGRKKDDSGERVRYIEDCRRLDVEAFAGLREERDLRRSTDAAGIGGIEERYDSRLRGQYGLRIVSVDMIHRPRYVLGDLPPSHGEDIRTTIDAALQVSVYEALERATLPLGGPEAGTAASAAVMSLDRAERGAILASAGFPGVDPNRLTASPAAYIEELALAWTDQTTGWLYDRPSRIPLHPGSLFKIIVALGALESARSRDRGPHDPAYRYECRGEFDKVKIHCNAEWGHGPLDLAESLGRSCNAYFFHLGLERVGPERLFDVAGRLGYGRSPGIDLSGPGASGLLVSPGVMAERYQNDPSQKDTARFRRAMCEYSIGQTFVEATPIQVLRSMAAVALRGSELPRPYIVQPEPADPLRFENPRAWETIHDGLWRAGHEAGGTAAKPELGLHRYRAAYKTGTAELSTSAGKLHQAWIAGFAPFEEPRIAFVAVVERTPLHGAEACASIVRAILDRFAEEDPAAYLLEVEEKKGGVGAEAPGR